MFMGGLFGVCTEVRGFAVGIGSGDILSSLISEASFARVFGV